MPPGTGGSQRQAEAILALSTEQGFSYWTAAGTILRGWARVEQDQGDEGVAEMRQGLAAWQATGAELRRPYNLALLAEAYGKLRRFEEGLSVLVDALAAVDKTGERFYEAELYRLKGELTLKLFEFNRQQEAEQFFLKAIDIARRQQARSWELRAMVSLCRLWQQQGRKEKAVPQLAEVYNWFTEGFDTADLKEAKALLDELRN